MKLQELVYISDPVRYGYKCPKCGNVQYSIIKEENNQMDYEKAYKEAIERARNVLNNKATDREPGTRIPEYIFPELAESKDERIRKTTVAFLKDLAKHGYENAVECIDWLEKQGEQKSASDTTYKAKAGDSLNVVNGKPFDYEHATITQKDFASVNYTGEEVVNAVKNTSILDMVDLAGSDNDKSVTLTVTGGADYKISVKPNEKAVWSKEDEEMANDLIEGCISSEKAYHLTHTSKEIADWLKSLKDRMKGKGM